MEISNKEGYYISVGRYILPRMLAKMQCSKKEARFASLPPFCDDKKVNISMGYSYMNL